MRGLTDHEAPMILRCELAHGRDVRGNSSVPLVSEAMRRNGSCRSAGRWRRPRAHVGHGAVL